MIIDPEPNITFEALSWILFLFSQQGAIMMDLRKDLPKMFPFQLTDSHIEVISGKQEGIYAWIAVNYALSKFNHIAGGIVLSLCSATIVSESPSQLRCICQHLPTLTTCM